ncbi:Transcription factor FAMA [Vitis vinifera]|uniref:Transcription factor FAMA n=1 Tax=Vitis vinifera TaxID=29760 RepID=A0A438BUH5_VITVI|nr:Transcription factor FAMA [Vitis vinifera]
MLFHAIPQLFQAALPASFTGLDYTLNQQQQQEQLMKPRIGEVLMIITMEWWITYFGPKLALNQTKVSEEETGIDPVYFLKFPVLNDKLQDHDSLMVPQPVVGGEERYDDARIVEEIGEGEDEEENTSVQLQFLGENLQKNTGDQASIIGGAIEFVRELEQLLQCLESQKRRRLFGDAPRQMGDSSSLAIQQPQQPPFFPPLPLPNDQINFGTGLREETAENKSCLADVEVRLLGFDAMIKILSRRRPGQLIKTIAALEDLQLNILHTNITTIEQTVLYSFNVKIASESRFTAEDIASSVQQILSFIHANSSI